MVVLPEDYATVAQEMKDNDGSLSLVTRSLLARKAFGQTSLYDAIVYAYLSGGFSRSEDDGKGLGGGTGGSAFSISSEGIRSSTTAPKIDSEEFSIETFHGSLPGSAQWTISKTANLRYGENPHRCSFVNTSSSAVCSCEVLSGKEVLHNSVDADVPATRSDGKRRCASINYEPCGRGIERARRAAYRRPRDETVLHWRSRGVQLSHRRSGGPGRIGFSLRSSLLRTTTLRR